MAITTRTVLFNSNDYVVRPQDHLIEVAYNTFIDTAGANAYPAGGEPIDFSAEFAEVYAVIPTLAIADPGIGGADIVGAMVVVFQRVAAPNDLNTGALRFYQGAVGNLTELAVGAYPNALRFAIMIHGRPITDSF